MANNVMYGNYNTNLQFNLNIFITFDTFSNLFPSKCGTRTYEDTTRNVARSNNNISSHSMISANNFKLSSSSCTFGINLYTIEDQA